MNNGIKSFAILSGLTIATLNILNRIEYSVSTVKNTLAYPNNNYYEWRFGKIRYTKKGSGTPILLLHDLTVGSSGYEFNKIMDSLSKNNEVYALDFLGYGMSDKPSMTYTSFLYVQLIVDFVKNIIGKKTDVIASGCAAPITIMTCHNNPEIFNKLILLNPESIFQFNKVPSKQTRALKFMIELPVLGTFIYNMLTTKSAFINLFQNKYYANSSKIQEQDITSYVEASHLTDHHSKFSFASYIGRYLNCNIIHAIKEINNSIIILAGEEKQDIETIIDNYYYYNNSIESSYIPSSKQYPHMENPKKVLQMLDIYLN